MSDPSPLLIDLSEAGLDMDRADLEDFLLTIADEMEVGSLVQSARLARDENIPEAAKSAAATFLVGILTTEVMSRKIETYLLRQGFRV